eukprot:1167001-Prymnesium_polylepis.1
MPLASEVSPEASHLSRSSTRRPRSSIVRMSASRVSESCAETRSVSWHKRSHGTASSRASDRPQQ